MTNRKKLTIAVDFDGTIVKNQWPEIGSYRFGARWCLKWLKKRGYRMILNTCREGTLLNNVKYFFEFTGIGCFGVFDYYNQNVPERSERYGGDCRKISADWYIDDRAGFLGWWSIPIIVWWLGRRKE